MGLFDIIARPKGQTFFMARLAGHGISKSRFEECSHKNDIYG